MTETAQQKTQINEEETRHIRNIHSKQKNTYIFVAPYNNEQITISHLTKCDSLPSEDIQLITNCICCSVTPRGGTIFVGSTDRKQRKILEFQSGNSKANTFHGRWTKFRTHKTLIIIIIIIGNNSRYILGMFQQQNNLEPQTIMAEFSHSSSKK